MSLQTESQQIYERSDLHELASMGQRNNFNIRRYNEKQLGKSKKQALRTKYTEYSKHRLSTQPIEDKFKQMSVMSYTNAFERMMNKTEPNHQKRMNLTGSLKHKNANSFSISKQKMQSTIEIDIQQQRANKCKQLQRKHNKGPIRKKVIETWLNSILTQSIQLQVIDQSLGNAALKKFQIDENSLLSRAVKPDNIGRIYQALFVHSIGFNNNIKELVANNTEVTKNIWKVFSVLLQYCAQGKFQTLVGIMERQKAIKIQQLRQEVAKRQQIIERNDQLNENKNIQIFKEIKHLKQQNINLNNEKEILFEDYQKTEQAFNEQVALRLKFQNKINELFGVHRQLAVKHQRLYDDYKRKVIEWNSVNQKNAQLTQQNGELKLQINDLITQKQRLISSQKYNKQYIASLKQDKLKLNDQYNIIKHQYDQERRLSKQHKRRVTQLQIQIKNLSQIVGIKDKSWKQTHSEYQLSLQENNRLYNVIKQQRTQVQSLLFQKKQFNNKILNLIAEASFQKRKRQQFSRLYYENDKKLKQNTDKIKSLQLQNKILSKKNNSNQADLKSNYENIKKMHAKNDQLQEQLTYLRKFRDSLDNVLGDKDNQIVAFRQQNQVLKKQNQELKTFLNRSEMNNKILKAQLQNQIQNHRIKLQKIKQQKQLLEAGDSQKYRALTATRLQLERTNKALQDTSLSLKNQKFQRVHLRANYDQLLVIMQKKNAQEKQMGRQISELKDNVLMITQQKNRFCLALDNQIIRRQRTQQELENKREQFEDYMRKKTGFVHPFMYQDVAFNFFRTKQLYQNQQSMVRRLKQQLKQTHEKYTNQIQSINKSNSDYLKNYKKQKQKEIFHKESLIEYQKQLNKRMKQKLEKLETLADTYTKKIEQRTTSEKQKIYAQLIQQKSKAIEQLAAKLNLQIKKSDTLHKEIIKKQEDYENSIITIQRKYKQENDKKQQIIIELNFQRQYFQKQVSNLKNQIKEYESKFQDKLKQSMEEYMQNFREQQQRMNQLNQKLIEKDNQQFRDTHTKWSLIEKVQKANPAIKKRNQMSRKIKIAYNYYRHQ